jgi:predicted transcriptional regulator YdeE
MEQVSIDAFMVGGESIRTNNALESGPDGKIPGLWERFFASHTDPTKRMYGVYSAFESDARGEFDVTAGTISEGGAAGVHIKAGKYLVFPANGPMPAAIIDAWMRVWVHFSQELAYARMYDTDFEEYSGAEQAKIFIGIK